VSFNDIEALKENFDEEVAGVIVEPIQGEGGICVAEESYLRTIRELCDEHGAVAIWDEVQSGMGRSGKWFAYQHPDIVPDIMTMAKALGGGVSIGGIMARPKVAASLVPGTHASTFGGNPLACAAAIATIEAIDEEDMLDNTLNMGRYIREKFSELQNRYSIIDDVRGLGLMIGIQLNEPGADIVNKCWEKGLRINCTQDTVLRFMPALNVTQAEIDQAIKILSDVMTEMNV